MPSDNPKYCDYVGDLLFNVDNSCYTDCVMELINRVILPYVVQETEDGGDNSLNILLQTLRQYALEGKFAQALGVARNFIWQSDRFPRGTMQDCRDVLHFLSDNSIKNSLCSTKKMQQHMCTDTTTSYMGPYISLLGTKTTTHTAFSFEILVQKSIQASTSKGAIINHIPEFLFLSNPIHPKNKIDYSSPFFHGNILYLMYGRICSSPLDGEHFWSYYLNDNDTVIKVDNLLHSAKIYEGLSLHGKVKSTVMAIYSRFLVPHAYITVLNSCSCFCSYGSYLCSFGSCPCSCPFGFYSCPY